MKNFIEISKQHLWNNRCCIRATYSPRFWVLLSDIKRSIYRFNWMEPL